MNGPDFCSWFIMTTGTLFILTALGVSLDRIARALEDLVRVLKEKK